MVLFQWLRAQSELSMGRRLPQRRARAARWELTQAELRLDVLTAGWFSAHRPTLNAVSVPQPESDPRSSRSTDSAPPAPPPSGSRVPLKKKKINRRLPGSNASNTLSTGYAGEPNVSDLNAQNSWLLSQVFRTQFSGSRAPKTHTKGNVATDERVTNETRRTACRQYK